MNNQKSYLFNTAGTVGKTVQLKKKASTQSSFWSRLGLVDKLLAVCCIGYLCGGRGFAELHIPGTYLYVGEMLFALSIGSVLFQYLKGKSQTILNLPIYILLILLGSTCLLSSRQNFPSDPVNTIRDAATFYYMLFIVTCCTHTGKYLIVFIVDFLRKYGIAIAILLVLEGYFQETLDTWTKIPGNECGLLFAPSNLIPIYASLLVIVALNNLHFSYYVIRSYITLILCIGLLATTQCRGATLGGLLSLGVYFVLVPKPQLLLKRLFITIFPMIVLIFLVHIIFPTSEEFLSINKSAGVTAKFRALVSADGLDYKPATGRFRLEWWRDIWNKNTESIKSFLLGQGFGTHQGQITGRFINQPVRAAHNAWVNFFGWTGIIGLILYFSIFVLSLFSLLKAEHLFSMLGFYDCATVIIIMLSWIIGIMISASFDNLLSNPAVCVPCYILLGSALALARSNYDKPTQKNLHRLRLWGRSTVY
jgi:hypothetical protein